MSEPYLHCKVSISTPGRVRFDVVVSGRAFQIFCDFAVYPEVKRRLFAQYEEEFDNVENV